MKYIIEDTTLSNIADAIRSKNGESEQYTPEEMATKIEEIEGGGSGGGGYTSKYRGSSTVGSVGYVVGHEEELLRDIENGMWIDGTNMFANVSDFDYSQLSGKNMKLTNLYGMFQYSNGNLGEIDFSNFDTSEILDFGYMFANNANTNLKTLDVTGINTEKGTNFSYMFYDLSNSCILKGLDALKAPKATTLSYMFSEITNTSLDIDVSGFFMGDENTIVTAARMFRNSRLKSIKLPKTGVITGNEIFDSLHIYSILDLSGFVITGTGTELFAGGRFYGGIILPDLPNFASPAIFDSITYIYRLRFGEGNGFGREYSGTSTLNLAYVWKKVKTSAIETNYGGGTYEEAYLEFVDSLPMNETGYTKNIKLHTTFYNSLSDEDKALITDKGYTITYGTS